MSVETKVCTQCRLEKPLTEFYSCKRWKATHKSDCKACQKKRSQEYQKKHKEALAAKSKRRRVLNSERDAAVQKHWRKLNREHVREIQKSWKARNKDRVLNNYYLWRFGISLIEVRQKIADQNGCCEICNLACDKLEVDHNHTTGRVRGMLCPNCNTGFGLLKEDADILSNAIKYTQKYNQPQ